MDNKNKTRVSIKNTLNKAFKIWKENFLIIAITVAIVYVPIQFIIEGISIMFVNLFGPNNLETSEDLRRFNMELRFYDFFRQLISIIATLGIFNFVYAIIREDDNKVSAIDLIKFGLNKWPENFAKTFYAGLIVLLYTLMLILPGIYKAVQFSFIPNLISDEESEPLEKSQLLVKDNWFDVFWMLIIVFLIALGIELVVALPFVFLPEGLLTTLLIGICAAVFSSYAIVIKATYYVSLKELKLNNETINEV